jgi:hypothetical protein
MKPERKKLLDETRKEDFGQRLPNRTECAVFARCFVQRKGVAGFEPRIHARFS